MHKCSRLTLFKFLVRVCLWVLGQVRGPWSVHGLPWVLLSKLWLSYCTLVFVSPMQSLSYIPWMENCSMTFSLEWKQGFYILKEHIQFMIIFCICSGRIYQINWKAKYKYMSPFSNLLLIHVHLSFSVNFTYIGGLKS